MPQTLGPVDRRGMGLSDLLSLVRHLLVLLVSFGVLRLTDDQILHVTAAVGAIAAIVLGAVWHSGKDRRKWWRSSPPPPKSPKPSSWSRKPRQE